MNGLANTFLTLLLSWLRMLVNRFWNLFNSETGNKFFTYLAEHWMTVLLALAVGGFVVDKIIYLIRWRPFSVRRRRRQLQEEADMQPFAQQPMAYDEAAYRPPYAAPQHVASPAPNEPYWDQPEEEFGYQEPLPDQPAVYSQPVADTRAYRPPMEDIEPVFDEQVLWQNGDELAGDPSAYSDPATPVTPQYMQDVNAGFARPVPPEQLYSPAQPSYAPPQQTAAQWQPPEAQPVHPGLNPEAFRLNFGIDQEEAYPDDAYQADDPYEEPIAIQFTPFTQQAEAEQPAKKKSNPFLNLMKLVGDEAAKPSIHDLQKAVDVRDAFRAPVYPQPMYRNEDDPT